MPPRTQFMATVQNRAITLDDLFPSADESATSAVGLVADPGPVDSFDDAPDEKTEPELAAEERLGSDRMHSAILALGRRIVARPGSDLLMHDALELLLDTFDLDCGLVAENATTGGGLVVRAGAAAQGPMPSLGHIVGERSLAGQAFATGQLQFSPNLAADVQSDNTTLRSLGIASAIAAPLRLVGENIGALVIGSVRSREFTAAELAGVEAVSLLLMSALAYYRADDRRQRQAELSQALQHTTPLPVVLLDEGRKIVEVNRRCLEISGFRQRDLIDRSFCEALCTPAAGGEIQAALAQVNADKSFTQISSQLLDKDGAQHAIVWSLCPTQHPTTSGPCLLLVGTPAGQLNQSAAAPAVALSASAGALPAAGKSPLPKPPEHKAPTAQEIEQLQAALSERNKNLRSSQRKTFPFYQPLAPYRGKDPADSEFFVARFRDISAGGLSFITTEKPTYSAVIVKLGTAAEPKKMIAKIVRAVPIVEDGKPAFLVGCTFIRRA
jgi:PAS domain S-box-containing protein